MTSRISVSATGSSGEDSQPALDAPTVQPQSSPAAFEATFPDYEVLEEIARGGNGVVFKARHRVLNRIVALKTLLTGANARVEERKRFQGEALAAAKLNHPGMR